MSTDISQLYDKHQAILMEYCRLAVCKELSPQSADELEKILAIAADDAEVNALLNEADHFLAHELGLLNEAPRAMYRIQQSKLRESIAQTRSAAARFSTPQSTQPHLLRLLQPQAHQELRFGPCP